MYACLADRPSDDSNSNRPSRSSKSKSFRGAWNILQVHHLIGDQCSGAFGSVQFLDRASELQPARAIFALSTRTTFPHTAPSSRR
jgi:hypothetical protein